MRQGPGGTATRFAVAASEWLQQGGADRLRDFYLRYGRDKWEIHP